MSAVFPVSSCFINTGGKKKHQWYIETVDFNLVIMSTKQFENPCDNEIITYRHYFSPQFVAVYGWRRKTEIRCIGDFYSEIFMGA